ncbi:unnamed protein product [Schistocephalus solidus]|uniref:C2H2-type domain-containing protein n=1 Tax=Schistocephalus solidus TaxID=70667 RepID=A0A183TFD7_SCHSO|nr:unnamed protein product [Schistocephalus solidus]
MATTPTTSDHSVDASPPTITDNFLHPLPLATNMLATATYPTRAAAVATTDYPPLAIFTTFAPSTSDGDSVLTCTLCDRTLTPHRGLVSHLQIHHIEADEPVSGAPKHSRRGRLQCPHCSRACTHRMALLGHMLIHKSGIHHDVNTSNTSGVPINTPRSPPLSATTSTSSKTRTGSAPPDLSCPHCHHIHTSCIGLFGHL